MVNEVVFILEISKEKGLGHWFRCLALSKSLKETNPIKITWLLDTLPDAYKRRLDQEKINYKIGKFRNIDILQNALKEMNVKVIILDLMDLERDYVSYLKEYYKVISIGGSGEGLSYTHICINGMIKRKGFIDEFYGEQLYMGMEYIILRQELLKYQNRKINKNVNNVYISLGGDYKSIGIEVANLLNEINPDLYIYVVLGEYAGVDKNRTATGTQILKNVDEPGKIMKKCDLAITSGGMTTFELLYVGVPNILISTTDFQRYPCEAFHKNHMAVYLGKYDDENLDSRLKEALRKVGNFHEREKLVGNGQWMIDGKGIQRVKNIIENEINRK